MSSTITIGFLDRTHVCLRTEFTLPLADDERRERLIHAALLTGRAFAALSYERQESLAGILREWVATRFESCPLQIVDGDPMACPQRFASTFLAPVREYALATAGCNREAGEIDYFLPMAAAAYLQQVTATDYDPEELLKPALALCAAVAIHPITVANHFEMAAASLPKFEPVVDRTVSVEQDAPSPSPGAPIALQNARDHGEGWVGVDSSSRRLPDRRRSLIVSACLAALVIMAGVQYLSTRGPETGGETAADRSKAGPQTQPKQSQEGVGAHGGAPISEGGSPSAPTHEPFRSVVGAPLATPHPAPAPLSPAARAYLRRVRDLAENSLAQVEVMAAAADKGMRTGELSETFDYGARRLHMWRRQFLALTPPQALKEQHREIGRLLTDLGRIAQTLRSSQAEPASEATRGRLSAVHDRLTQVLNDADVL